MRRAFTWASGAILASIFFALASLLTSAPTPAPAAPAAAFTSLPAASSQPVTRLAVHPVTRTGHPQPAAIAQDDSAPPASYTARRGDTLSSIASTWLGHANRWPALWYANRKTVRNPDALKVGTQLSLAVPAHPVHAWLAAMALAAIPVPPAPRPVPAQLASGTSGVATGTAAAPAAPAAATGSITPGSGYEACVIDHESSGNAGAVNPSSGAGGLYGFLPSTWASLGYSGLPENAPVAEQQQAFDQLYAQAGSAPWMTDGC